MNGSDTSYQPSQDLPPPQPEGLKPLTVEQPSNGPAAAETASQRVELPPNPPAANPLLPFQDPVVAVPVPPANPAPTTTPIPVTNLPSTAEDTDLIEKEWVNKAKHIVNSTREDPHRQNQEMNKFKATYIQQRYNKQLKVSDD